MTPTRLKDEIGNRYGRLLVIARSANGTSGKARWECVCDCGSRRIIDGCALRHDSYSSCGCLRREASRTHGLHDTRAYTTWHTMKQRCCNPRATNYELYGGRGIGVCSRWLGPNGFLNFFADMGQPPPGKSLDRVDVNGDYSPENTRWADARTQNDNRRSSLSRVRRCIDETVARVRDGSASSYSKEEIVDLLIGLRREVCGK